MYDNGTYNVMKSEPIWPLINHSDCEGDLTIEEMKQILPQLIAIVNIWEEQPDDSAGKYEIDSANELIDCMECAIECNEPLEFM